MSIHLYRHNEDAYQAAERMLDEKGMAAVIHPTGSGKSMIAFKLAERIPKVISSGCHQVNTFIRLSWRIPDLHFRILLICLTAGL